MQSVGKKLFLILCSFGAALVSVQPLALFAVSTPTAPVSAETPVAPLLPDLTVTRVSFSRTTLVASAMVENRGTADISRNQRVIVYFEFFDAAGERVRSATVATSVQGSAYQGIRVGRGVEYQLRKNDPGAVSLESAAAITSVKATVNASGSIDELSGSNNSLLADAVGVELQTDVIVQTADFDRTTRETRVVVKNQGGGKVAYEAGQYFFVQVKYLGSNGDILATATERGPRSYGLAGGGTILIDTFVAPPPHVTNVIDSIQIVLNTEHLPYESPADNNTSIGTVRGEYPLPDLVITSARFDKQQGRTTVSVINSGTVPIKTSDRFGVTVTYLDASGTVLTHATGQWSHAYELAPGRGVTLDRFVLEPSARIAAQVDRVTVVADTNNVLVESHEDNNVWPSPVVPPVPEPPTSTSPVEVPVVPDVLQVPDLTVSSVVFNQTSGIPTVVVKNVGNASVMSLPVGIGLQWLNAKGVTVGASVINISEAITAQEIVTVRPGQVPDGAAILRVSADSVKNRVAESDETNNSWEGLVENGALSDVQRADLIRRIAARALARTAMGVDDAMASQMAQDGDVSSDAGEHAVSLDLVRRLTKESGVNKKQSPRVVPGNPLYFFKNTYRKVRTFMTFDEGKKAQRQMMDAAEKTLEAGVLASKGKDDAAAKQIAEAQKDSAKAVETTKRLIEKNGQKGEEAAKKRADQEQKVNDFLKVISRPGSIEKSVDESTKKSDEQARDIQVILKKSNDDVRAVMPVRPVATCTADEWECTWNACVWVGPGTEQGKQSLNECHKVSECAATDTPAPVQAGTTRDCAATSQVQSAGPAGSSVTPATPTANCTADTWSCSGWSACDDGGTQTELCTLVKDCPGVDTPRPRQTQACVPDNAVTEQAPATEATVYPASANAYVTTGGRINPQRIDIAPGGTITFQNVEFETHDIIFSFGSRFTLAPGESKTITAPTSKQSYNVYTDSRTSPVGSIVVNQ